MLPPQMAPFPAISICPAYAKSRFPGQIIQGRDRKRQREHDSMKQTTVCSAKAADIKCNGVIMHIPNASIND